jgi:hypothetical protein
MGKRAFDTIMQGIDEAHAYLSGRADKRRYRVHARKPSLKIADQPRKAKRAKPTKPWRRFGQKFPTLASSTSTTWPGYAA